MIKTIELGFYKIELTSDTSGQWFRIYRPGYGPSKPVNITAAKINKISNNRIEFKQGIFTHSFTFKDDNKFLYNIRYMVKVFHTIPYWQVKGKINTSDKQALFSAFQQNS